MFKSHLFGSPTIVTTDAEVSRFILQSDASTFVPWYPKSLTELMGKSSILLINGSLQKRIHGLISAFFKSPHLKARITRDMQCYVLEAMNHWKDDRLIYIQDESKRVSPPLIFSPFVFLSCKRAPLGHHMEGFMGTASGWCILVSLNSWFCLPIVFIINLWVSIDLSSPNTTFH